MYLSGEGDLLPSCCSTKGRQGQSGNRDNQGTWSSVKVCPMCWALLLLQKMVLLRGAQDTLDHSIRTISISCIRGFQLCQFQLF